MVVAALAAFTMAAITTAHARRAQRAVSQLDARCLAEGAIARTIGVMRSRPSVFINGSGTYTFGSGTRQAIVTFDPQVASTTRLPGMTTTGVLRSTGGGSITEWSSTPVATISATAVSDGVKLVVEAKVGMPLHPYVISTTGRIESSGTLICRGATSSKAFDANPAQTSTGVLGHINGLMGIKVSGTCNISGDVVSRETTDIDLLPEANVGGQVRAGDLWLPTFAFESYDPLKLIPLSALQLQTAASFGLPGTTYTLWDSRHYAPVGGTLRIQSNLNLEASILYVEGDVVIEGGLTGRGFVVATGNVTVLAAVDQRYQQCGRFASILAGGDVTLQGTFPSKDGIDPPGSFQGMVWANGCFNATNITLAGIFMSGAGGGGALGSSPGVTLTNVTAVYLAEATCQAFRTDAIQPMLTPCYNEPHTSSVPTGMWKVQGQVAAGIFPYQELNYGYTSDASYFMQTAFCKVLEGVRGRLAAQPGPFPQVRLCAELSNGGTDGSLGGATDVTGTNGWSVKAVYLDQLDLSSLITTDTGNIRCRPMSWVAIPVPPSLYKNGPYSLVLRRGSRNLMYRYALTGGTKAWVPVGTELTGTPSGYESDYQPDLRVVTDADTQLDEGSPVNQYGYYNNGYWPYTESFRANLAQTSAGLYLVSMIHQDDLRPPGFGEPAYPSMRLTIPVTSNENGFYPGAGWWEFACGSSAFNVTSALNTWLAAAGLTIDQVDQQQRYYEQVIREEYLKVMGDMYKRKQLGTRIISGSTTFRVSAVLNEFFSGYLPLRVMAWQEHE